MLVMIPRDAHPSEQNSCLESTTIIKHCDYKFLKFHSICQNHRSWSRKIEIMELLSITPVTYLEIWGIFPHSSKLCALGLSSQEEICLQGNPESVKLNFELCLPPSCVRFLMLTDK